MKVRYGICAAGLLLGVVAALMEYTGSILLTLMRPWTALGSLLRAWSLSGAAGNACAWAFLLLISLLPTVCMLILRRKRRQKGDILWLLTSLSAFPTLFFLINPTHLSAAPVAELSEVAGMALVMTTLSLLAAALLTRWAGGLQEARLPFWTGILLTLSMALTALSIGWVLTEALLIPGSSRPADPFAEIMGQTQNAFPDMSLVNLILTVISLIPEGFALCTLESAARLTGTLEKSWFSSETQTHAEQMARCARRTLIAAVCCAAGRNAASVLLGSVAQGASVGISVQMDLPLFEMLLSCGAMLLSRWLAAACKVKHDNDLMI